MAVDNCFRPGQVWLDTEGKPIQAHGGGVLFHNGRYFWYGEDKSGATLSGESVGCGYRVDVIGVHCYSSADLYHWQDEGLVLPAVPDDPSHDLHPSKVAERPKVVFNEKTGKFVLWLHIDHSDYAYARAGMAVSDSPTGPFKYLGSIKPNGGDCRDMTVYVDGSTAWLIHSSEWNATMYFSELTPDFLGVTGNYRREFVNLSREAPAVFQHAGQYYMLSSACTGWDPNAAGAAVAPSLAGPWQDMGNPCIGPDSDKTYLAQSTFVLPVQGREGAYIFMADRWKKEILGDSRYVWLPVTISDGKLEIEWVDEWDLSYFDN